MQPLRYDELEVLAKSRRESNIEHRRSNNLQRRGGRIEKSQFHRQGGSRVPAATPAMNTSTLSTPTAQERDPVCGMNVNPATAKHTHEHAGKKYYFCCAGCADKFKANPAGYLNPPAPKSGLVTLGVPSAMKPSQAAVPSSSSATLSYPSSSSAALSSAALSSRAEPALRDSGTQAQSRDLAVAPSLRLPHVP